jgi:hypothetical protein
LLTYQFQILIKLVNARKLNYEQIIAAWWEKKKNRSQLNEMKHWWLDVYLWMTMKKITIYWIFVLLSWITQDQTFQYTKVELFGIWDKR